jgi:hypothetical protein
MQGAVIHSFLEGTIKKRVLSRFFDTDYLLFPVFGFFGFGVAFFIVFLFTEYYFIDPIKY